MVQVVRVEYAAVKWTPARMVEILVVLVVVEITALFACPGEASKIAKSRGPQRKIKKLADESILVIIPH